MWGGCQQPENIQCESNTGYNSGNTFVLIVVLFILLVIVGTVFY